jgi:hypothetical protein
MYGHLQQALSYSSIATDVVINAVSSATGKGKERASHPTDAPFHTDTRPQKRFQHYNRNVRVTALTDWSSLQMSETDKKHNKTLRSLYYITE